MNATKVRLSFLFFSFFLFLFFFSSLFLHFFFFPFSFLFLFFIFSRFFSGRFGRFLGFGLHTGLQQRAVKRRNFSSRRCTRGWRICVTRVDWKLWENNVGGFFFLRARIRFGDYPFFLNKEQIQSIYFFEFLKFFYGRYEMILNWSSCWLNYAISNSETVNACTFHGGSDSTLLFFFFFFQRVADAPVTKTGTRHGSATSIP